MFAYQLEPPRMFLSNERTQSGILELFNRFFVSCGYQSLQKLLVSPIHVENLRVFALTVTQRGSIEHH